MTKAEKGTPNQRENSGFVYDTEIGKITVESDGASITAVRFGTAAGRELRRTALIDRAAREIREYLAGARTHFDLPLSPAGTAFQKCVWEALQTIPYGETRNYQQIAEQIGCPHGSRAVGMANHKNPIAILIPCHRVIGSDGSLVGYAAGLPIKERLLALEKGQTQKGAATEPDGIVPYQRRAHYYETDQMGIVHHSNYIRWMEEARLDFLEQLGWGYEKLESGGLLVPVIAVSCRYKSPVRFGETVCISVAISSYQGTRLSLDYLITDQPTGHLRATGRSEHCFCNRDGRPIRLRKFSQALDKLLSDHLRRNEVP